MDEQVQVLRGGTILAFDGGQTVLIPGGDIAYRGAEIVYVGSRWMGPCAASHDVRGSLVMPGFISTHTALGTAPTVSGSSMSASENLHDRDEGSVGRLMCQLLLGGVTTVVMAMDRVCEAAAAAAASAVGIRLLPALRMTNGLDGAPWRSVASNPSSSDTEPAVALRVERCIDLDERGADKLRAAAQACDALLSVGVASSAWEFHRRVRESGATPVEWLAQRGLLSHKTVLTDCQYLAGLPGTAYPSLTDVEVVRRSKSTLCLMPMRDGLLGRPSVQIEWMREHGLIVSIGVGAPAYDPLEELRALTLLTKIARTDHAVGTASDAVLAATMNGARALGRIDLGVLQKGATADIVAVNMKHLRIGPSHDPVRSLISSGDRSMITRVVIAGRTVVQGGRLVRGEERSDAAADENDGGRRCRAG